MNVAADPVNRQLTVFTKLRVVVSCIAYLIPAHTLYINIAMNVLILTPDRVGSTLLQRLLTIYMNMQEFDRPVINLHELTNMLIKYVSNRFNQEVLGKPGTGDDWGYHQTLPEIVELLKSVDHYKTSRLAHYHIVYRKDSLADQLKFYQYLNENFFIISAQRENLLEHALSWCIQLHTKKLNVYSHGEKVSAFLNVYQDRITVEPESLEKYLNQYIKYLQWVDDHFQVSSYFKYERDLPEIEKYILNLPIFNRTAKLDWNSTFGVDWKDWNKCHYLMSDLSGLSQQAAPLLLGHDTPNGNYHLTVSNSSAQVLQNLSELDQQFLFDNHQKYQTVKEAIDELVRDKVLISSVPIKLQTMLEKKLLIKNFNECVDVYNNWAVKNNIGKQYTDTELVQTMQTELLSWHQQPQLT